MNTMQKKMMKIANEGIEFYTKNPEKRAVNNNGTCMYKDPDTGNRCIVGRHLSPWDTKYVGLLTTNTAQSINSIWDELKTKSVKELPVSFWEDLQDFHDNDDNWLFRVGKSVAHQISETGLKMAEEIRDNIKSGKYL